MGLLLMLLLLLHRGDALISVTTISLGDPVTFMCLFPDAQYSNTRVKWYRQRVGDTLTLITTLMKATLAPTFEPGFPSSRFNVSHSTTTSILTILKTVRSDEAMYHCAVTTWSKDQWSGSFLGFTGNSEETLNYSVVQSSSVSGPVRPGDSVSLQCSVVSDSKKTCPGGPSVYWIKTGSDKSGPGFIYTGVNNECDSVKSCVYSFSKNVSSSDAGTYHCAVASCGHILFGSGTKLEIQGSSFASNMFPVLLGDDVPLPLLCAVLVITLVSDVVFLFAIRENRCDCSSAFVFLRQNGNFKTEQDSWVYSAAVFTVMKTCRDKMKGPHPVDRRRS